MSFQDPPFLLLLLLVPPWAWFLARPAGASIGPLERGGGMESLPTTLRSRLTRGLPLLRALALVLAILAFARPQLLHSETVERALGVDLVVALDVSTSMLAEDGEGAAPRENRLERAKKVLADFLGGRSGDRIGLVVFAARPYPAAPLTADHAWLREVVAGLRTGLVEDGTALGEAILAALNRLRGKPGADSTAAAGSRAIILITDGRANAGEVDALQAARAARALGIRIHAIGIGSQGTAVIPVDNPLGGVLYRQVRADLDETTLRAVAETSGGGYFRADDGDTLGRVFAEIGKLEKRPVERKVRQSARELFPVFLLAALALGAMELVLNATVLRKVP